MPRTRFRVNPDSECQGTPCSKQSEIWRLSDCNWTRTHNNLVLKRTLNHLAKLVKKLSCVVSTYLYGVFNCMFLYVTYAFQSESTPCICLNVKELLARNKAKIWSLSDSNWTRTHNHLVRKRTFSHLAKTCQMIQLCCGYLSVWCI